MYSRYRKASWSLSSLLLDSFFPFLQLGREKAASFGEMVLWVDARTLGKPLLMEGVGRVGGQEIKQGLVLAGSEVFELGRGGMG